MRIIRSFGIPRNIDHIEKFNDTMYRIIGEEIVRLFGKRFSDRIPLCDEHGNKVAEETIDIDIIVEQSSDYYERSEQPHYDNEYESQLLTVSRNKKEGKNADNKKM